MKPRSKYIAFLLFAFCITLSVRSYSQLTVNVGKDTTYCSNLHTTKIPMGLKVKIQNGIEPYTYAWDCVIVPYGILKPQTASDILNDSTLMSPTFKRDVGAYADQIILKLHVTDHTGNTATDSIKVRFSKFTYLTGYIVVELNKGDSTQFKFSSVGGGIEPLKYQWQPRTGLSNPDSLVTWAKPEVSTQYNIIATDSCGCVSEPNLAYEVRVKQASLEFAPIGAEWYINHQELLPFQAHGYNYYKVIKDTVVNSKVAKLIRKQEVRFDGKLMNTDTLYTYEKDSKIYYLVNGKFIMFYDFSKKVGDTINYEPEVLNCDSISPVTVKSVSTFNIGGFPTKEVTIAYKLLKKEYHQYEMNYTYNERLSIDYFYPECSFGDHFTSDFLRCYHDNTIQYVGDYWSQKFPNSSCDSLINLRVSVKNINKNVPIQIYPNPAKDIVLIHSKDPVIEISVFNLQGQKVLIIRGNPIFKADISKLPEGFYIMQAVNQKGDQSINRIYKID